MDHPFPAGPGVEVCPQLEVVGLSNPLVVVPLLLPVVLCGDLPWQQEGYGACLPHQEVAWSEGAGRPRWQWPPPEGGVRLLALVFEGVASNPGGGVEEYHPLQHK